jgi:hypothetical protein
LSRRSDIEQALRRLAPYDELLAQDYDRDSARFFVAKQMAEVLAGWGSSASSGRWMSPCSSCRMAKRSRIPLRSMRATVQAAAL